VRPTRPPLGLTLARVARLVSRAFDETLGNAGGSLPIWLVLLNLKIGRGANQRKLAEAVGVTEATLTHHLNAMETAGLVTRRRDPDNRRVHVVELTDTGEAAFLRLREAAMAFDRKLRRGLSGDEVATLEDVLGHLAANVANDEGVPPWSGLIERGPESEGVSRSAGK
jgi:MarR family transcriptional regulator, transcriptional regulator for hemolysin